MLRHFLPLLALLACCLPAQESKPASLRRDFHVPLHGGQLCVGELVKALCTELELDAADLRVPDTRIDLRGPRGSLVLLATRKLLLDTTRFRRDLANDRLLVTIDRERTREVRRQLRSKLAGLAAGLVDQDVAGRGYELALPDVLDPKRPLCVLVHGVESDAEVWQDLRGWLCADPRRCQVATFGYPNDESIERVAKELAARLKALGPQPVVLVGHSMGGLVARAVVEDPALDPGTVRTLIQVGTPNAGSSLAGLRVALEAREALLGAAGTGRFAAELLDTTLDRWRDGLGEAGGDLLPGSVCLTRLEQRPRNPRVEYRLVLGTRSLLTQEQLAELRTAVTRRLADEGVAKLVRPRLERWLSELDELVDGKGDGAVSVAKGRLEGVEPVLVPLDHVGLVRLRGILGRVERAEDHPVFVSVAEWVAAAAAKR